MLLHLIDDADSRLQIQFSKVQTSVCTLFNELILLISWFLSIFHFLPVCSFLSFVSICVILLLIAESNKKGKSGILIFLKNCKLYYDSRNKYNTKTWKKPSFLQKWCSVGFWYEVQDSLEAFPICWVWKSGIIFAPKI